MPIAWALRSIISSQTAHAYGSFASTASEIVFMSMFSMMPPASWTTVLFGLFASSRCTRWAMARPPENASQQPRIPQLQSGPFTSRIMCPTSPPSPCYLDIKNAIYSLGVQDLWNCTMQPMQFTYKPTGQSIIFRGLDDPLKLASIRAPPDCYLCWVWFEEAFEITDYQAILKIQASIRAIPPESGLKKKFFFTFNPWHKFHWLKDEFFDKPREDTVAVTTTYLDNPGFTEEDKQFYRNLEIYNPKAAEVIVHGEWGSSQGQVYENWEVKDFDPEEIAKRPGIKKVFGLDFGYSVSYNAFSAAYVDVKNHELWIYDELYDKGMTNADIAKKITQMGYAYEHIIADCAEPKSIYELKNGLILNEGGKYVRYILPNIEGALKGKDSVINGIQRLQTFKIWVLPKCKYHIMELSSYSWAVDKDGQFTGKPEKEHDHLADALRMACDPLLRAGKGRVAVARGAEETPRNRLIASIDMSRTDSLVSEYKCRRVFATHE